MNKNDPEPKKEDEVVDKSTDASATEGGAETESQEAAEGEEADGA